MVCFIRFPVFLYLLLFAIVVLAILIIVFMILRTFHKHDEEETKRLKLKIELMKDVANLRNRCPNHEPDTPEQIRGEVARQTLEMTKEVFEEPKKKRWQPIGSLVNSLNGLIKQGLKNAKAGKDLD